jgi:leader peptidase (prepilin peptidase)/N-methyltransferase
MKMDEYEWRLLVLCVFWWTAAVSDLRSKMIPIYLPVFFFAAAVVTNVCLPTSIDPKQLWTGAVPGGLLLLLSFVLKGKIGEGDGICLLAGGIWTGISYILIILEGALVLVSLTGMILIAARRGKADEHIPFLPFLAGSASMIFLRKLAG